MSKAFGQLEAGDRIEVRDPAGRWWTCTVKARGERNAMASLDGNGGMVILTPATEFRAVTA